MAKNKTNVETERAFVANVKHLIDVNHGDSLTAATLILTLISEMLVANKINVSETNNGGYTKGHNDMIDKFLKQITNKPRR